MGEGTTDPGLVSQARRNHTMAIGELIKRHQGVVFAFALSYLPQREAAQDLAADVFLRAQLQVELAVLAPSVPDGSLNRGNEAIRIRRGGGFLMVAGEIERLSGWGSGFKRRADAG